MNSYLLLQQTDPDAPAYSIGEVEEGVNYAIVISTNGGLWRYVMGDTVIFYQHQSLPYSDLPEGQNILLMHLARK